MGFGSTGAKGQQLKFQLRRFDSAGIEDSLFVDNFRLDFGHLSQLLQRLDPVQVAVAMFLLLGFDDQVDVFRSGLGANDSELTFN
jgi:hypothetical protein